MPFTPFKKRDDIGSPEPLDMPKRKMEMPEPEEPAEAAEPSGIAAIGERYGLAPDDADAFARDVMQHFMGMCGEAKPEVEEESAFEEDE